ncbi:MAG TPA: ATP-binding protein [Bacteroidota bacterium]|nr:ATP-binding protein [Bacteroidota bacterium]
MNSIDDESVMANNNTPLDEIIHYIPSVESKLLGEQLQPLFGQYKSKSLVVTEAGAPIGFLSYRRVNDLLSTQFGYAVYQKRPVTALMLRDFLFVESHCTIGEIVERALEREQDMLYEDIVVIKDGLYLGLLSIAQVLSDQRRNITEQIQRLEEKGLELEEVNSQLKEALANLRKTEQQLLHSEKMASIGTLAAGVAHDFNNMLAVIESSTYLLKTKLPFGSPLVKYCDMTGSAIERSADLIKQLLQFSQKNVIDVKCTSLNKIVHDMLRILERSIGKNINVDVKLDENLPTIEGDETQLQQVIMNLAINARDAMPEGGTLTISTESAVVDWPYCKQHPLFAPGSYLRLVVQDTGCGIPQENLQRIFDPFFTTKKVGKGTGLGLSVVHGIVERHGGTIQVYSEVGKGTVFHLYFKPSERGTYIETAPAQGRVVKGSGTILIVDDEELLLEPNAEMLVGLGYRVLTASSGFRAVDIYRARHAQIDMVLLDMAMPGMDGRQTFREMKAIDNTARVLFASGFTDNEKFKNVIDEGALGLIRKPFNARELSERINSILRENGPVKKLVPDSLTVD